MPKILSIFSILKNGEPVRLVKISQEDLQKVQELYLSVMSKACHGLFFREGFVYGGSIAEAAIEDRGRFFELATNELTEKGWVESITFNEKTVTANGSIESYISSDEPSCHRLRGIIRKLYEVYTTERVFCSEASCVSKGDPQCVFTLESNQF